MRAETETDQQEPIMAGSNYPPGVTGNEIQISGPTEEWETQADGSCDHCGWIDPVGGQLGKVDEWTLVIWQSHPDAGVWWLCPQCGKVNDRTPPFDEGPDPDDLRDQARDLAWEDRKDDKYGRL